MSNEEPLCATPGEFFTAREILRHRKDLELCFPIADRGWDLLALKKDNGAPVRIQVKESRVYTDGNSWHQIKKAKLTAADIFVFVIYTPVVARARTAFTEDFLVIPRMQLSNSVQARNAPSASIRSISARTVERGSNGEKAEWMFLNSTVLGT
jgi:hypothetical protein